MGVAQHSKTYADAARRLPGFLVAWDSKLILRFQTNPTNMTISKATNWQSRNIPGWEAPIYWWSHGGKKTVRFELEFDSTDAVSSGGISLHNPALPHFFGLQGVEAVLESFVYPQRSFDSLRTIFGDNSIPNAVLDIVAGPEAFTPPPEVYFIFGLRVWKGHIGEGQLSIEEMRYDRLLNPTHLKTTLTMTVHEEGTLHKVHTGQRVGFALMSSASSAVQSALNLVGVPV